MIRGKEAQESDGLQFGRFGLGFAVNLLEYVYEVELQRRWVKCFFYKPNLFHNTPSLI